MAKKRTGTSSSQHIRDHLENDPNATPKQIVEGLAAKGIQVSPGLVSNVKFMWSQKGKKKRTAKKKAGRGAGRKKVAAGGNSAALSIDDLVEAKKLVDGLGGINEARKALDALASLQK